MAVDGAGNVYIADANNNAIKKWDASTHKVTPVLSSGLHGPFGLALGTAGNIYIADSYNNAIKVFVHAYVPGGAVSEGSAAGPDALLGVLPSKRLLAGLFLPKSDQKWLTIGSIANGVIHFSFTANTGAARTAHITVLGKKITVTQAAAATHGKPASVWTNFLQWNGANTLPRWPGLGDNRFL